MFSAERLKSLLLKEHLAASRTSSLSEISRVRNILLTEKQAATYQATRTAGETWGWFPGVISGASDAFT